MTYRNGSELQLKSDGLQTMKRWAGHSRKSLTVQHKNIYYNIRSDTVIYCSHVNDDSKHLGAGGQHREATWMRGRPGAS